MLSDNTDTRGSGCRKGLTAQEAKLYSMSFAWTPKIFGVVDSTIANKKIIYRLCLGKWQVLYSLCLYWARVYCCAGLQRFIKMSISSKCVISVPISRYLQSPHSSVTYWAGWGHGDITIIRCTLQAAGVTRNTCRTSRVFLLDCQIEIPIVSWQWLIITCMLDS